MTVLKGVSRWRIERNGNLQRKTRHSRVRNNVPNPRGRKEVSRAKEVSAEKRGRSPSRKEMGVSWNWNLPESKRDPNVLGEERIQGGLCPVRCAEDGIRIIEEWSD